MFERIPAELRGYKQWVVWRLEFRPPMLKPTKVPYYSNGKAAVNNPSTWMTFDDAIKAPFTCIHAVDPDISVQHSGYTGIGFIFTFNDPYAGIDLDSTKQAVADGKITSEQAANIFKDQSEILTKMNSYAELSPSGDGLHIIVKGQIPQGKRANFVEVYSSNRFFTMTGNVYYDLPIEDRSDLLLQLYADMGSNKETVIIYDDSEQTEDDQTIFNKAKFAANGDKFLALYQGDWQSVLTKADKSQSEADFALIDIIAFYSDNKAQIKRMFRASQLGTRDKAKREKYVDDMVERSFDRKIPKADTEAARKAFDEMMMKRAAEVKPGGNPPAALGSSDGASNEGALESRQDLIQQSYTDANGFPPGLIGEIARFILAQSARPVSKVALAGAIAMVSGITGRAYNVGTAGLNQYILLMARTGIGKDAIASGIAKLITATKESVPGIETFNGPGELVSSAGLHKALKDSPTMLSVVGEIGLKMKEMASPTANAHTQGLQRMLLQIYSKSGFGQVLNKSAYSDKANNTDPIFSPSFSLIGETVPESFYDNLDETVIRSGLLPRFMTFEYLGKREYYNHASELVNPPIALIENIRDLAAQCLSIQSSGKVHKIEITPEAKAEFDYFDKWTTDEMNAQASNGILGELWNRAHLKALKLAAAIAVGINYLNPIVTLADARYATNLIVEQTENMLAKFANDEVGSAVNNAPEENKQRKEMLKVIGRYMAEDYATTYHGTPAMHKQGVISASHISQRMSCLACFKNDRFGTSAAIKKTLALMVDYGELGEMPQNQMKEKFGIEGKAYFVKRSDEFVKAVEDWKKSRL